jgi:Spx/MgsR family transcriptional regulator
MQSAMTWLDANGVEYTFHDYKKAGVDAKILARWIQQTSIETVVNTKGLTFKKLSDADKKRALSAAGALEMLMKNTSMIKRPIVEAGKKLLIGFDEIDWSKALL